MEKDFGGAIHLPSKPQLWRHNILTLLSGSISYPALGPNAGVSLVLKDAWSQDGEEEEMSLKVCKPVA
jgi:hypothetical protein